MAGRLPAVPGTAGPRLVDGADVARVAEEEARAPRVGDVRGASARNRFRGVVTRVTRDTVMAQVEVQAGPFRVVSLLSREAVDELIGYLQEMHDSDGWKDQLAENGRTDDFKTGDDFAEFIDEQDERVSGTLEELGLL